MGEGQQIDELNTKVIKVACMHCVQCNFLAIAPVQMATTALQIAWEDLEMNEVSWTSLVGCDTVPHVNLMQAIRQFMNMGFSDS